MASWIQRIVSACSIPVRRYLHLNDDDADDSMVWSWDIGQHSVGEFSVAIAQGNVCIEDHSQVETGRGATFVGVYDGHGGPDASRYILDNLFPHLIRHAQVHGTFSEDTIRNALSAIENEFLEHVRQTKELKPSIATIGSCCLIGLIWKEKLYVANLGDSRAVIGHLDICDDIIFVQLTQDHNVNIEEVRHEIRSIHSDDSQIVILRNGVWRVKGIIQVSRSIGDAYLKLPEFIVDPSLPRFQLPEPLQRPALSAEPSIYTRVLSPRDRFVIFASDGLWEQLTNQEAVQIVSKYPKEGIARRLVHAALEVAARKRGMRYSDLIKLNKGARRLFHDDITVVVVYINHELLHIPNTSTSEISIRGFIDVPGMSDFFALDRADTIGGGGSSSTV